MQKKAHTPPQKKTYVPLLRSVEQPQHVIKRIRARLEQKLNVLRKKNPSEEKTFVKINRHISIVQQQKQTPLTKSEIIKSRGVVLTICEEIKHETLRKTMMHIVVGLVGILIYDKVKNAAYKQLAVFIMKRTPTEEIADIKRVVSLCVECIVSPLIFQLLSYCTIQLRESVVPTATISCFLFLSDLYASIKSGKMSYIAIKSARSFWFNAIRLGLATDLQHTPKTKRLKTLTINSLKHGVSTYSMFRPAMRDFSTVVVILNEYLRMKMKKTSTITDTLSGIKYLLFGKTNSAPDSCRRVDDGKLRTRGLQKFRIHSGKINVSST